MVTLFLKVWWVFQNVKGKEDPLCGEELSVEHKTEIQWKGRRETHQESTIFCPLCSPPFLVAIIQFCSW